MPQYAKPLALAGLGLGAGAAGLDRLLEPLDWARQAAWNVPAKLAHGDVLGALPGLLGAGAGALTAATGVGLPLAGLVGSAVGGLAQGIGKGVDEKEFEAPDPSDLAQALGTEKGTLGNTALSFLLGAAGDPLSYAGGLAGHAGGARAGRYLEQVAEHLGPNYPTTGEDLAKILGGAEKWQSRMAGPILDNPELARIAREVPPGSSFLGGGAEGMVLRAPDGHVIRIGEPGEPRPDSPLMLQPARSVPVGGSQRVEHLPFLDVPNEEAEGPAAREMLRQGDNASDQLAEAAIKQGLYPWDMAAGNVGRVPGENRWLISDPGAAGRAEGMNPAVEPETFTGRPGNPLTRWLVRQLGSEDAIRQAIQQKTASVPEGAGLHVEPLPPEPAPPFYSRLQRALEESDANRFKTQGLLQRLEGGKIGSQGPLSREEMEYTGLPGLLQGKQAITREDLLRQVQQNPLDVAAVRHGGQDLLSPAEVEELAALRQKRDANNGRLSRDEWARLEQLGPLSQERQTQYGDYQTPGGQNYQETLLTLGGPRLYDSPHFSEPNILAHIRTNERTLPTGEKALHAEEIQSDWHQAGKEHGYLSPAMEDHRRTLQQKVDDIAAEREQAEEQHMGLRPGTPEREASRRRLDQLRDSFRSALKELDQTKLAVPEAPFKNAWHELAIKQLIRDAAERGSDVVTWNPGEQIQKLVGGGIEGQKQFYDKKLPAAVQKIIGPYGGKVGRFPIVPGGELVPEDEAALRSLLADEQTGNLSHQAAASLQELRTLKEGLGAHGFRMTPALREAALKKGFPLLAVPAVAAMLPAGDQG